MTNNFLEWILFQSLRRQCISDGDHLRYNCRKTACVVRGYWLMANGRRLKIELHHLNNKILFDRWVERACFQYHPVKVSVPTPWVASRESPVSSLRDPPASPVRPGSAGSSHVTCPAVPRTLSSSYPRLTGTTSGLFVHETHGDNPTTVHAAPSCTVRVINTLLRVVHGGSSGWGSSPHGYYPDNLYPTENQDPLRNRIVFDDLPTYRRKQAEIRSLEGTRNMTGEGRMPIYGNGKTNQHWYECITNQGGNYSYPKKLNTFLAV